MTEPNLTVAELLKLATVAEKLLDRCEQLNAFLELLWQRLQQFESQA